jgi:hypothetical protein
MSVEEFHYDFWSIWTSKYWDDTIQTNNVAGFVLCTFVALIDISEKLVFHTQVIDPFQLLGQYLKKEEANIRHKVKTNHQAEHFDKH